MATAKQIAARKLFAERAKAGAFAKRKKNPSIPMRAFIVFTEMNPGVWKQVRVTENKQVAIDLADNNADGGYHSTVENHLGAIVYDTDKRANNPLTRVKVKSPSYRTGKAPSKRLVQRRKSTKDAPAGYYANPAGKAVTASYLEGIKEGRSFLRKYGADDVDTKKKNPLQKIKNKKSTGHHAPDTVATWNDHFIIQTNNDTASGKWSSHAVFKTLAQAESYARALARSNPRAYIRVIYIRAITPD